MPIPISMDATWLNPASVQYNAQELRQADSAMFNGDGTAFGVRGGIVRHGDTSLNITVDASDIVTVQSGAAVIPGNSGAGNGCYRAALGAATTGALAARNATNPRITLVVFRALDTDVVGTHGAYTGRIEFIDGVAAASPVAPALPALAVELARITVPATAGGAATVDLSFRQYVAAVGGVLAVASISRLPAADSKWDRAVALDTGVEYRWTGTAWIPALPNEVGVWRWPLTSYSWNNPTSYTVIPDATERAAMTTSFVKAVAGSKLLVTVNGCAAHSSGLTQTWFLGLRIGGVDYDVSQAYIAQAGPGVRATFCDTRMITGIAAGTLAIEPVFKSASSSQISIFGPAAGDRISYSVREVY